MKISSGYKNLNYAIAWTCFLGEDKESRDRRAPFLPKPNVAWGRSARLDPSPGADAIREELVKKPVEKIPFDLSKTQKKRSMTASSFWIKRKDKLCTVSCTVIGAYTITDLMKLTV